MHAANDGGREGGSSRLYRARQVLRASSIGRHAAAAAADTYCGEVKVVLQLGEGVRADVVMLSR